MSVILDFDRAIREEVRRRLMEIMEEEVTAARVRIAQRLNNEADRLALNIMKNYSLEDRTNQIVITVKKP